MKLSKMFFILIGLLFVSNVEAAGISDIKLICPDVVNYNEEFVCNLKANITDVSDISEFSIKEEKQVKELKVLDIKTPLLSEGNTNISEIKVKAGDISITSKLTFKLQYKVSNISNFQVKYATSSVKIVSNVNTLKEIKIDDKVLDDFTRDNTNYELKTKNEKINIVATRMSNKSIVTGDGEKELVCGVNEFSITVTAENNEKKVYNLNVLRECEDNPYLKSIKVSNGVLSPKFNKEKTKYKVEVGDDVDKITIEVLKEKEQDIVIGDGELKLKYGSNKVNIVVKNKDDKSTTYTIDIIRNDSREKSALLSFLSLSNGNIEFDENIFNYEVKVLYDVKKIFVLTITKEEDALVKISGNDNLKVGENIITVKVVSETEGSNTYTIKVTRLNEGETLGDNPNIKDIIIKDYDFIFEEDKDDYKLVIKNEKRLDIKVLMEDKTSTYEIVGNDNLKDNGVIKIITKAQDGSEKEYNITVTKLSYIPFIIITILLFLLPIGFFVFIYFKYVKKKKENLDVNGYKIDDEDVEVLNTRKIISKD